MRVAQLIFVFCASVMVVTFVILLVGNRLMPYYKQETRDVAAEHDARLTVRNMSRILANGGSSDPWLYVITPTATTLLQEPELLRLGQTLSLPLHVHWVLVAESLTTSEESSANPDKSLLSPTLIEALDYIAVPYTVIEKQTSTLDRSTKKRFSIGLDWVRNSAPRDAVVMFLEQSSTIDHRLLDQIRWTKGVSSWPLGLLDQGNTVTNPFEWAVLRTTADVETKGCKELPTVELESLAVSVALLQQTQAHLDNSSPCPATFILHELLKTGANFTVLNSVQQGQAYAWKTRTYMRSPKKVLQILQSSNRGSNLDYLQNHLLIDLYKRPAKQTKTKKKLKK